MKLSTHFSLDELTFSQQAARLGIDNTPNGTVIFALTRLCDRILEPLRNAIDRPLFVSSGYRCPALNDAVHGAKHSDHLFGLAADITAPGLTVVELADRVHTLAPYVELNQCIVEFERWVHVSCLGTAEVDDHEPEFLTATLVGGVVKYDRRA